MKACRVTRSCSVFGSWQSMQATGYFTCVRASVYGIAFMASNPFTGSPPPRVRIGTYTDA